MLSIKVFQQNFYHLCSLLIHIRKVYLMQKNIRSCSRFYVLDRAVLLRLKLKAMRAGLWFRLPRIDRVLLDLTVKVTECVHSSRLAQCLHAVAMKLEVLLGRNLGRALNGSGIPAVRKLSSLALKWGYVSARSWTNDLEFARFWAIMSLNGHPSPT